MKQNVIVTTPVSTQRVRITTIEKKSVVEAYILALVLGWLGAHHFYLRRPWFGIAYLFTFGLFGVGYLVDLFRIPCLVKQANRKLENPDLPEEKNLCDAYLLWFPCGLFGFHLHYLRKPGQGVLYFFTLGLFGIGFLVDLFRIPSLVKAANKVPPDPEAPKSLCIAYILGASPLGIIGMHHYYLNRPLWGILYTFTFGLLGLGWVYDWFRMPFLVKRSNAIIALEEDPGRKHIDDIYILWFPLGWLGFHHFYLRRTGWGVLYFCTIGLFGIGWLVDFCRLPCLVSDYNKRCIETGSLLARHQGQTITNPNAATVITVTNIPAGSVMVPPDNTVAPPTYSYQNMTTYPPQNYPGQQTGGQQAPYYSNQGFYPNLNDPYVGAPQADAPMPPTYEESIATPDKSGPPPDVDHSKPSRKS